MDLATGRALRGDKDYGYTDGAGAFPGRVMFTTHAYLRFSDTQVLALALRSKGLRQAQYKEIPAQARNTSMILSNSKSTSILTSHSFRMI